MKLKSLLLLLGIPLLLVVVVIAYVTVWPWVMIGLGSSLLPNPSEPEITSGEFPFRLEYEMNGERKIVQDTLICEYDGIGWNEGQGKYRKWKQRLASGNEKITLLKVDETKEIYYPPGSTDYYMDDLKEYEKFSHIFPNAAFIEKSDRITHSGIIRSNELVEKYNIKLISWEPSLPIKNSFPEAKK